jgi:hypothetical protein
MILDGNMVLMQNVRCSYPNLIEATTPKLYPNSPPRFNVELIIAANDPIVGEIMQVVMNVASEKWKEHTQNMMQAITMDKTIRGYHNAEEKVNKKTLQRNVERYPDGMFVVSTKAKPEDKPTAIDSDGNSILENNPQGYFEVARSIYDGCRINAVIRPWCWNETPGISFQIHAFQFAGDDQKFSSASRPDVSGHFGAATSPNPQMGGFAPPQGMQPVGVPPQMPQQMGGFAPSVQPPGGLPDFMK